MSGLVEAIIVPHRFRQKLFQCDFIIKEDDITIYFYRSKIIMSTLTSSGSLVGLVVSKLHACYLLGGAG